MLTTGGSGEKDIDVTLNSEAPFEQSDTLELAKPARAKRDRIRVNIYFNQYTFCLSQMESQYKILCIIPARSGSKGIPHKNIMDFHGKPLMAWSIEQALQCKYKLRIIVSTDNEEYQIIARKYGAEVPFLRPSEISHDTSTPIEYVQHCVDFLCKNESYLADIILVLQPTSPLRTVNLINSCIDTFLEKRNIYDSCVTFIKTEKSPFKMFYYNENTFVPLFKEIDGLIEPYNQSRQRLPIAYLPSGDIFIMNTSILEKNTIMGDKVLPVFVDAISDIDTLEDFKRTAV